MEEPQGIASSNAPFRQAAKESQIWQGLIAASERKHLEAWTNRIRSALSC